MKNVAIKGKYIPQNKSKFLSRRKPVNDISYKDEIFEINYTKFTFLKKRKRASNNLIDGFLQAVNNTINN
tara:strand:+ start:411 stop:620 length:210 start_codon:yes stop_codon:yes gene_type:complete